MDRKEGGKKGRGVGGNNVAFGVGFKNIWVSRWVWRKNEWFCYCEEEASGRGRAQTRLL